MSIETNTDFVKEDGEMGKEKTKKNPAMRMMAYIVPHWHLQRMSAAFHSKNQSGSLVTRVSSDIEQVHDLIWGVVTNIWIDGITIIIYIVLLCRINVFLTIVACLALPASVMVTKQI